MCCLCIQEKNRSYGQVGKFSSTTPDILVALVDSFLEKNNVVSEVLDLDVSEMSDEEVSDCIDDIKPYVIGVFASGVNVSASTQTMPAVIDFFEKYRDKCLDGMSTFVYGGHPE